MKKFNENKGCGWYLLVILLALAVIFAVACFEGWLVMLLWNAIMPLVWAGAPKLSFWVAVGILLLCNLLFKGVSVNNKKDE